MTTTITSITMSTNWMSECVSCLRDNRENFVKLLSQNYTYSDLVRFGQGAHQTADTTHHTAGEYFHELLQGNINTKYIHSAINWLPSKELVIALLKIASMFHINCIEIIHAELGILGALMEIENNLPNNFGIVPNNFGIVPKPKIISSDTFLEESTCFQMGYTSIARRSVSDFKYYDKLRIPFPDMIISSYYPSWKDPKNEEFIVNISNMLNSMRHRIIILILPNTFFVLKQIFNYFVMTNKYSLLSVPIKAIDKYYHLYHLSSQYYEHSTEAHIFIQNSSSSVDNQMSQIKDIIRDAVIHVKHIDEHAEHMRQLKIFFTKLPYKLFVSSFKLINFAIPIRYNIKIGILISDLNACMRSSIKHIPTYIYEITEFRFWTNFILNYIFFVFDSREQFFQFYVDTKQFLNRHNPELFNMNDGDVFGEEETTSSTNIEQTLRESSDDHTDQIPNPHSHTNSRSQSNHRRVNIFPSWINTNNDKCIYIYLSMTSLAKQAHKRNRKLFNQTWADINERNKNILTKN